MTERVLEVALAPWRRDRSASLRLYVTFVRLAFLKFLAYRLRYYTGVVSYTIFVAEVASTCNEHLLIDHILKNTDDDAVRLFLLGSYIDGIRQKLGEP